MKNLFPAILTALMVMLAFGMPCPTGAQAHARQLTAAMEAYQGENYTLAIKAWETVTAAGIQNSRLYYNLGNAYLKNDDLGRAILWYERALELQPTDTDLRFNLKYARSLTKNAQDKSAPSPARILFFWNHTLASNTTTSLALAFNLLFWTLALLWRLSGRRSLRYATLAALFPAALFIFTATFNFYHLAHSTYAIVLPDTISARSGFTPATTELFELHAGARVRVCRTIRDHVQIRFPEDKIGWVESRNIGRI